MNPLELQVLVLLSGVPEASVGSVLSDRPPRSSPEAVMPRPPADQPWVRVRSAA